MMSLASRRRYGTAIRASQIASEASIRRLVLDDCDWIVPEIDMKWNVVQPAAHEWNFAPADEIVRFAATNALGVRGHTIAWEQSTPDWAKAAMGEQGGWAVLERFIASTMSRYADQVAEWDVVNEPIDTDNGADGMRLTSFHRAFGATYVDRLLRTARGAAPTARLFVNEYGLEYGNHVERDRRARTLRLLRDLRRDGAPIDGLGIQAHLDLGKGDLAVDEIRDFVRAVADLGLRVTITELDVKEHDVTLPLAERDRLIAEHVRRYLDVVLAEKVVGGVVTWGLSDRDSWLRESDDASRSLNRGLPFDAAMAPKPFYYGMHQAIRLA